MGFDSEMLECRFINFSLKKKVIFYLFKYCPWLAELLFSIIRSKKVK